MAKQIQVTCFYCDCQFIAKQKSGDHFPIPKRNGGIDCVPCCQECHSLKDRIPLDKWDGRLIANVINDFPNMSRDTRLFLAKSISLFSDAIKKTTPPAP